MDGKVDKSKNSEHLVTSQKWRKVDEHKETQRYSFGVGIRRQEVGEGRMLV